MIEAVDNSIQLIITAICSSVCMLRAVKTHAREWTLLGMFSGVFFLGDLYWTVYLLLFSKTPFYTLIPDVCWLAAYLFMLMLLFVMRGRQTGKRWPLVLLPVLIFTSALCVYYCQFGSILSNIIYGFFMTMLMWQSLSGLIYRREDGWADKRRVYLLTFIFCLLEYAMWTSSCLTSGDTLANPYYWFDLLLSVSFILYLPAVRKAVEG